MQNMSDNELDDLFKEAAEGFKPPQDASAWEQMAARLDQAAPISGFWNWKTISGLTATGIIAITATWYALTPQQNVLTTTDAQHGSNNATQGVVQEQKEQTHKPGDENFTAAQPVENQDDGNGTVETKPGSTEETSKETSNSHQQKLSSARRPAGHNDDARAQKEVPSAEKVNPNNSSESKLIGENAITETSLSQQIVSSADKNKPEVSQDSVQLTQAVSKSDSLEHSAEREKNPEKEKVKSRAGFSIKLAVSPDFSSVNFFSASKPGINFGVLAGYSFNSRWSVYTGVISSKKLYTSKDVEGSYSWAGHDYPVKELDGDCRIIDIPINVYYSFFPERSFSLKVGLGFSSYVMRKETYNYCVDNYGTDAFYEQRVKGENNEWFKILNLSVMAEKKLTNRLSAEFEPFVKAPLAGVGEGKVSLVSMGAFINLKFDLSNNK
jgi:Outer membrane protein beta-barrel domain